MTLSLSSHSEPPLTSAPASPAPRLLTRGTSGLESAVSLASDWGPPSHASTPARPPRQSYYARPGYSFGVSYICDDSKSGISALAFASVRSDLLAFANQEGELFILHMHLSSSSTHTLPSASSTPSKHHGSDSLQHPLPGGLQHPLPGGLQHPLPGGHAHDENSILVCSKIHALRITSLDWSFDNSQVGEHDRSNGF